MKVPTLRSFASKSGVSASRAAYSSEATSHGVAKTDGISPSAKLMRFSGPTTIDKLACEAHARGLLHPGTCCEMSVRALPRAREKWPETPNSTENLDPLAEITIMILSCKEMTDRCVGHELLLCGLSVRIFIEIDGSS